MTSSTCVLTVRLQPGRWLLVIMKNKSDISLLNILTRFMVNTLSVVFTHIQDSCVLLYKAVYILLATQCIHCVYESVCVCEREFQWC